MGEFTCNGCNKYGSSATTYRCVDCNYDLHEYCATCPRNLRNFSHPPHDLRLVFKAPQHPMRPSEPRVCNLCEGPVEGLFYECEPCEFRVHPQCTKLPQFVRDAFHPEHPLELFNTTAGACIVCGGACISWRYCCFACKVHAHMKCLASIEMKHRSMQTPQAPQYHGMGVPYYGYGQPPPSSMPQYIDGKGSASGHRRANSCGANVDGGNGNETPKKNKNKALKFASRFGIIAAQAMALPGLEFLVDNIQGSDDSSEA